MGILDNLLAGLNQRTSQMNSQIFQGAKQLSGAADAVEAKSAEAAGMADTAASESQNAGELQAQVTFMRSQNAENIQRLYDMDPENAGNFIAQQLADKRSAQTEYAAARGEYDAANQVGLLDNPLGFILNTLQKPKLAAKVNAAADKEDLANQRINQATAQLQATKASMTANTSDLERDANRATVQANYHASKAKVLQFEAENASRVASMRMDAIRVLDKTLDNDRSNASLNLQYANVQEARAARAAQTEANSYMKQLQSMMLEEKLDERARMKLQREKDDTRLAIISKTLGLSVPVTMDDIKNMTPKEKEQWVTVKDSMVFGNDVLQASEFLLRKADSRTMQTQGNASLLDAAKKIRDSGTTEAQMKMIQMQRTGVKMNEQELRKAAFEGYQLDLQNSMTGKGAPDLSSHKWDGTYNPYVAPMLSFSAAIDSRPELVALKGNVFKKHVDELVKSKAVKGDNLSSEQVKQALQAMEIQVARREITAQKAAADISSFFAGATTYNQVLTNYSLLGLPPQTSYAFTLGEEKTDLLDPAKVENALTKLARERTKMSYTTFGAFR